MVKGVSTSPAVTCTTQGGRVCKSAAQEVVLASPAESARDADQCNAMMCQSGVWGCGGVAQNQLDAELLTWNRLWPPATAR
jgi:hypothetical protein